MVTPNEVSSMANILAIMNGSSPSSPSKTNEHAATHASAFPDAQDNIDAMKKVLQSFYGTNGIDKNIEQVTRSLVNESNYDSELRSAMITEKTDDGSKLGDWKIYLKEDGKRKYYDVINENGMVIASDLTLYEAAFGIARALSDGLAVTCKMVRSILIAEDEYARALSDAIHYKYSLSKKLQESRRMILEDRYDVAKERALTARRKIEELVKPPF